MGDRSRIYFVSDVHLGLDVKDAAGRERRFVSFLEAIPASQTQALYLLGDIWDFWYEYKYVVPKGYCEVFAALKKLMDGGVEVYFFPGNHDRWAFHYFQSLGIKVIHKQPYFFEFGGKTFCVGHGDGLGPGMRGYKLMQAVFKNPVAQWLFNLLHPRIAFGLARRWSKSSRLAKSEKYDFKGAQEPLYKYALEQSRGRHIDCFVFGHYHVPEDIALETGARLIILDDWMDSSDYLYCDGISVAVGHSPNIEK